MKRSVAYTPTWLYKIFDYLNHLPIPLNLVGLGVLTTGTLISHFVAWDQGAVTPGTFNIDLMGPSLAIVFVPWLWLWLDDRAREAIAGFLVYQKSGTLNEQQIMLNFLSLPTVSATALYIGGIFAGYVNYQTISDTTLVYRQVLPWYAIFSFVSISGLIMLVIFRTIRQNILTRSLYSEMKVNIFNPASIYSLSRYLSQSTLAILMLVYGLIFTGSSAIEFASSPFFLAIQILLIGGLIVFFFYQFAGINKRMRAEKAQRLTKIGLNLETIYDRIDNEAAKQNYAAVSELRNAAATLRENWELTKKLSTWPWEPETLRTILFPLVFPLLVYLLQRYAAGFLGL